MGMLKTLQNNKLFKVEELEGGVNLIDAINGENKLFLSSEDILSLSKEIRFLLRENSTPDKTPILNELSNSGVFNIYGNSNNLVITDGVAGVFSKSLDLEGALDLIHDLEDLSALNSIIIKPSPTPKKMKL